MSRDLIDRLFLPGQNRPGNLRERARRFGQPSFSAHDLPAILAEYAVGQITRRKIIRQWNLKRRARVQLNKLLAQIDAATDKMNKVVEIEMVLRLSEQDVLYAPRKATEEDRKVARGRRLNLAKRLGI